MIGGARLVEKNESAGGGSQARIASFARIVKFSIRLILCCDRRMISSAAVEEFYETCIEAALRINWKACRDIRSARGAGAFEVHGGVVDDMERRTIFGAGVDAIARDRQSRPLKVIVRRGEI